MIFVDTSVWIAVFRRHRPVDLERWVPFPDVVTCLPVVQEVLQGFRDERAFQVARESLYALPIVESPLKRVVFDEAIELYRRSRQAGLAPRSSVDCLIAACALRHGLTVVHRDRDFSDLARISSLEARDILRQ